MTILYNMYSQLKKKKVYIYIYYEYIHIIREGSKGGNGVNTPFEQLYIKDILVYCPI